MSNTLRDRSRKAPPKPPNAAANKSPKQENAAASHFTERAAQLGREQFEVYASKTKTAFEQNIASMEANGAQVRSKLKATPAALPWSFSALSQHVKQTLAQGVQDLEARIDEAKETLQNESQALQRQFRMALDPVGNAAIDEHKKRLENASNAWLLTTVTKLTEQSEARIEELAESTDRKLKAVCSAVIAEMGATLRQRLGGLISPPSPGPEDKK